MAIVAALIAALCVFCAVFAHWVAPHNPFDLATVNLSDSRLPPAWEEGGSRSYLLGTDDQGRDILSAIMYGARISLFVGVASVLVSMVVGVGLGLLSGFVGGKVDALHHARLRRDAVVPVDAGGAADRRRRPRDVPERARHRWPSAC